MGLGAYGLRGEEKVGAGVGIGGLGVVKGRPFDWGP